MRQFTLLIAFAFALCLAGPACSQIALSAEQERDLYTSLLQVRVPKPPPASFNASEPSTIDRSSSLRRSRALRPRSSTTCPPLSASTRSVATVLR